MTNMYQTFGFAQSFNGDLSAWDISRVTNMFYMFSGAKFFNADVSKWDVRLVTNMEYMFGEAFSFNRDLTPWNVRSVVNMKRMFFNAQEFHRELCGDSWIESSANKTDMFTGTAGGTVATDICVCNTPGEVLLDGTCVAVHK